LFHVDDFQGFGERPEDENIEIHKKLNLDKNIYVCFFNHISIVLA